MSWKYLAGPIGQANNELGFKRNWRYLLRQRMIWFLRVPPYLFNCGHKLLAIHHNKPCAAFDCMRSLVGAKCKTDINWCPRGQQKIEYPCFNLHLRGYYVSFIRKVFHTLIPWSQYTLYRYILLAQRCQLDIYCWYKGPVKDIYCWYKRLAW